jgi:hypothetical protein
VLREYLTAELLTKTEKRKFIKDARQRIVMGDINDFIDNEEKFAYFNS